MADPHDRWRDDLVAYELGALQADEAEALERHLEDCTRCRRELDWLLPALETLPASVEPQEPPPELRQRLMAIVRSEAAEAQAPSAGVPARRPRIERLRRFALSPAGAVAAVAVVGAGLAGYAVHDPGGRGTTTIAATPTQGASTASATVVKKGDEAMLHVDRLPALRRGHVYEVWLRRGDRIEPSSVFVLRRDGTATAAIPQDMHDAEEMLVTSEPDGGSDRPSTAPVLRATLD